MPVFSIIHTHFPCRFLLAVDFLDIAGTGKASESSLVAALTMAAAIARQHARAQAA